MIVNLRPESLGLLDCVVEECDERFTTEQQDEIVRIVGHVLGREGDGVEENGVNGHGSHGEVVNGNGTNGTNRSGDHGEEMEENGST